MRIILTLFIPILSGAGAMANTEAADACKAGLSPVGQQIYTETMAQNPTKSTAKGIVTAEVKKMISAGKVSVFDGKSTGEAVGECMKLLE